MEEVLFTRVLDALFISLGFVDQLASLKIVNSHLLGYMHTYRLKFVEMALFLILKTMGGSCTLPSKSTFLSYWSDIFCYIGRLPC